MSCVSLTRLCNFERTRTNVDSLRHLADVRKDYAYNNYFNTESPCRQSMIMTNIEAEPCCHALTPVGGCLVGTVCEGAGALIDCCLTASTCGACNAQRLISESGDGMEETGSGIFQGCLGVIGNALGNCIGSIFACVPYMLAYAACLPKNCCIHYCCPPTQEEENPPPNQYIPQ